MTNIQHITRWVETLESGNYSQAREKLAQYRNDNWSYCCLGVACVVADLQPVTFDSQEDDGDYEGRFNADGGFLPYDTLDYLGIDEDDPELDIPVDLKGTMPGPDNRLGIVAALGETCKATVLNDVYELTFPEIARCIRHTYLSEGNRVDPVMHQERGTE